LMSAPDRRAEVACNRFAANLLVPPKVFRAEMRGQSAEDEQAISKLAEKFSVSREVLLRRCLDEGWIDEEYYSAKVFEWNRDFMRQKEQSRGGNWYLTKISYLGEGFTRLAFERRRRGDITAAELASHLNVKARYIRNLRDYLG